MNVINIIISFSWLAVVLVWIIYGKETGSYQKKTAGKRSGWIRFVLLAAFVVCFAITDLRKLNAWHLFPSNGFIQVIGAVCCIAGVCFAIWALIRIGKSWGLPMSRQEKPVLVTTGPYRFVRHPIYAGLCVAMIGSMVSAGFLLLLWYCLWTLYFIYSGLVEEKMMTRQFPEEYQEFRKKTKMFIPFVY